ncbi:DUF6207 family protein [Streptomyces sp. NPDC007896]|uniref:DUF6207 family protein n=1 Tax=Streptomyces sp. NPDC007896 TaxID=3364784 RepID=UPI0036ED9F7E
MVGVAGAEGQSAFALRAACVSMRVRTAVGRAIRDPGRPGVRPCCCVGRRRRSGVGRLGRVSCGSGTTRPGPRASGRC